MMRAKADQILLSRVITDLVVGPEIAFAEPGLLELKGLPGR